LADGEKENSSLIDSDVPHVTICVPAFDAENTLGRTLESIVAQDYPHFDVLECDNPPTDNTAKIANEYATRKVNRCHISTNFNKVDKA
jgi:glycosyltransferase involved in cell wall biosynthesis